MRVFHALPGWVAVVLILSGCQAAQADLSPRVRLLDFGGHVTLRSKTGGWQQVRLPQNRDLKPGDEVQTHQHARARIAFGSSTIEMGPLSHIIVPTTTPARRSLLQLIKGKILVLLMGGRPLEVETAGAIASARGTEFLVAAAETGKTTVTVLEGAVDFHNDLGTVLVSAGEQSTAAIGQAPTRPMRVDPSSFIDWEATPERLWLGFERLNRPELLPAQREAAVAAAGGRARANPMDAAALTAYADLLHDAGDYPAAEDAYRAALALEASDQSQLKLGFTLLARGLNDQAAAAFGEVAKGADLAPEANAGKAVAVLGTGSDAAAAEATELAVAAIRAAPADAQVATMAGFVHLRAGQVEAALVALRKAVALDPEEYRAYAYQALALTASGELDEAEQSARQAVGMAPASSLAHEALAGVHFYGAGDEKLTAAQDEVALALELAPNSPGALLLAAQIEAAGGRLDTALDKAEAALALNPQLAPAHQLLGMLALARNDVARAEKVFRQAVQLQPRLPAAMTGLGQTLAQQGRFALALDVLQAAVALDDGAAASHNNLGAAYLQTGKLQEAAAEFRQAISLQPEWALAHGNLALACLEMNLYAQALAEGEQAVKLGARSARVHTTLARVYLRQNRVNKAWAALRRALELDPDNALARMHLAEVYVRLGLSRESSRESLRALTHQPSAMVDDRNYARTEVAATLGTGSIQATSSGRGDRGQNSYYVAGRYFEDDYGRPRTDVVGGSGVAFLGRQTSPDRTGLLVASGQRDDRDMPGRALTGGAPSDLDYQSRFDGGQVQLLSRFPAGDHTTVTTRAGYRWDRLSDENPDSLLGDPNPLRRIELERRGPTAEIHLQRRLGLGDALIAGAAWHSQSRSIGGLLSQNTSPVTYAAFRTEDDREIASGYLDWENRLNERTRLLLGGRTAFISDGRPVFRPRVSLRYKPSTESTVALVSRPVLADDVSELSPVDEWGTRFWLSPVDLARGGFSQSYELQYELQPLDGSLLRAAIFHRELRNLIVDLEDPTWAVEPAPLVLGRASFSGVELEYERWLTHNLSGGVWMRWMDTDGRGIGASIPYQPAFSAQARLDYLDENGWRLGLLWQHVGRRAVDAAGSSRLPSFQTVDLQVARQVNLHTDVFLLVENLLNEEYEFFRGYPGRDRHLLGGVRQRF